MKITPRWPGNQNRNRKKRATPKPKIRWQQLGLKDPSDRDSTSSIDEIRRQVMSLSSRGLAQGARSRPGPQVPATADAPALRAGDRKARRGAA